MKPIDFPESNVNLVKPKSMSYEECGSLPAFVDDTQYVSKWELSEKEKKHVAEHGYIWIKVLGQTHPPISPVADADMFDYYDVN